MSEQKRTLIFINLIITSFSSSLLATAMVVALPHIAADLNVSLAVGQWVTSGFALAGAIIAPLSAFLINRVSTKKLYLSSLILIIAGLGICAAAQSFAVMIGGRVIQAASGAILGAMAQVILLTVYPREKHGTIMGWYGLAMGFGPVIAPTISGILMDLFSWRMVFVVSIALMIASFICALFVFDNFLPTATQKFDTISFVLSALAFGGLTLGAGNITNYGILDPFSYVPLLIGIITVVIFTKLQLALSWPLLDLKLLNNRTFALATTSNMLHSFVMSGSAILFPTLMQTVYHYSATQAGLFMLIPSIVFAMVSPIAGKIYDTLGIRNLYIVSAVTLFLSHGIMIFADETMPLLVLMTIYAVRNGALAMLMMPLTTWGMSALAKEQFAQGTAVMNTLKNVAGAIGSAVVIGFMAVITQLYAGNTHAEMYGFNGAFAFTTVFTVFMVAIAVFVKPKNRKK